MEHVSAGGADVAGDGMLSEIGERDGKSAAQVALR